MHACLHTGDIRNGEAPFALHTAPYPHNTYIHIQLHTGDIFNGEMPYGLHLVQFPDENGGTRVEVFDVHEGGTAAQSGLLRKGDRCQHVSLCVCVCVCVCWEGMC